jgi:hypothetical protein
MNYSLSKTAIKMEDKINNKGNFTVYTEDFSDKIN